MNTLQALIDGLLESAAQRNFMNSGFLLKHLREKVDKLEQKHLKILYPILVLTKAAFRHSFEEGGERLKKIDN